MKIRSFKGLIKAAVASSLLFSAAAWSAPIAFGGADFSWNAQGSATPNHIWIAGDYWDQAFAGSGSVNSLSIDLKYDDNTMSETLNLDVVLDGMVVGSFSIAAGATSTSKSFSFADIALDGTDDLKLLAKNTISGGAGSVSLLADGRSSTFDATGTVPEPTTAALVAASLLALGAAARRRRA